MEPQGEKHKKSEKNMCQVRTIKIDGLNEQNQIIRTALKSRNAFCSTLEPVGSAANVLYIPGHGYAFSRYFSQ